MTGPLPWTAVLDAGPDGVSGVDIDGGFEIGAGVCNGGYVLAVLHQVAQAALMAVGAATTAALSVSSQFLAPTPPGPATVRITRMTTGRSVSRVEVDLDTGGRTTVRATFSFVAPAGGGDEQWRSVDPPAVASAGDCRPMPRLRPDRVPWPPIYWHRVELLVDPGTSGFLDGAPSGRGEIRTWWSSRQPRVPDAGLLLVALDAMPPCTFDLGRPIGASPTVSLEARFYGGPGPDDPGTGPFLVRQQVLTAGPVTADQADEVWDTSGRLLATATQINWLL